METKFPTWRRKNRLALEDAADLTAHSISMLSRVERGERNLSPQAKVILAKRLGVRIRDHFPVQQCDLG